MTCRLVPACVSSLLTGSNCLQIRRKVYASAAVKMGWDKILVVQPPQLKSSENMLAELFEVLNLLRSLP